MRLESDGRVVELHLVGYQFSDRCAEGSGSDWDANWLQVSGDVVDGDLVWHFEDPCLTTREARALLGWLRQLTTDYRPTDDQDGDDRIWFTEPNVHFSTRDRSDGAATVVVSFAQESSPPGAEDEARYTDGYGVALRMSTADLARAADEWERELEPFPER